MHGVVGGCLDPWPLDKLPQPLAVPVDTEPRDVLVLGMRQGELDE